MIRRTSVFSLLIALCFQACAPHRPPAPPSPVAVAAPTRVAVPPAGAPSVWPASAPSIYASSAILIDASNGEVLYQKNADIPRAVASTQKLLTALIVVERDPLDGIVVIQPEDVRVEPTKLGVRSGESYLRRELLASMLVKSCNDVATALGRSSAGSTAAFAMEMNERARQLGAENSYFLNPSGLPAPQHSTARDMARIAYRAYRQPVLRLYMNLPAYSFRRTNGRTTVLKATNKLLTRSPIYNGMKTGYTVAAGRCFIASASANGRDLILVQLGSKTSEIFDDAELMLQWGFGQLGGASFGN